MYFCIRGQLKHDSETQRPWGCYAAEMHQQFKAPTDRAEERSARPGQSNTHVLPRGQHGGHGADTDGPRKQQQTLSDYIEP